MDAELVIAGWPARTIEPPATQRRTFQLEDGRLVAARSGHEPAAPPDDACLLLAGLDLDDQAILRFVNTIGVALTRTPRSRRSRSSAARESSCGTSSPHGGCPSRR